MSPSARSLSLPSEIEHTRFQFGQLEKTFSAGRYVSSSASVPPQSASRIAETRIGPRLETATGMSIRSTVIQSTRSCSGPANKFVRAVHLNQLSSPPVFQPRPEGSHQSGQAARRRAGQSPEGPRPPPFLDPAPLVAGRPRGERQARQRAREVTRVARGTAGPNGFLGAQPSGCHGHVGRKNRSLRFRAAMVNYENEHKPRRGWHDTRSKAGCMHRG